MVGYTLAAAADEKWHSSSSITVKVVVCGRRPAYSM